MGLQDCWDQRAADGRWISRADAYIIPIEAVGDAYDRHVSCRVDGGVGILDMAVAKTAIAVRLKADTLPHLIAGKKTIEPSKKREVLLYNDSGARPKFHRAIEKPGVVVDDKGTVDEQGLAGPAEQSDWAKRVFFVG